MTMTFKQLVDSTGEFATWRRNYPNAEFISEIGIIPFRGIKSILFTIQCRSYTTQVQNAVRRKKGEKAKPVPVYTDYIQFMDVKFGDRLEDSNWAVIEYKNQKYYFRKPSLFKNPVKVRCNCPDFQFRFSWEDRAQQALYGGPPKVYIRKTPPPPLGRPEVNPEFIPGICKHLYDFAKQLEPFVNIIE